MRRLGMISIMSLALLALVSAGVLAKSSHAPFSVKADHAPQGGSLTVRANSTHSVKGAFRATAIVHFASGDVNVVLSVKGSRHGGSGVASVKVPVSQTEQPGRVRVDVTITYRGATRTYSTRGFVDAPGDDSDVSSDD